jgi:hypothetical protein
MNRYVWTINGQKFSAAESIRLRYGGRLRIRLINETMMAHTMHLHGMFVQFDNGQPGEKFPNKHAVIIAPYESYTVLFTAGEPDEWVFHCHMIYHMLASMMTKVIAAEPDESNATTDRHTDYEKHTADSMVHGHKGYGAYGHSPIVAPMDCGRQGTTGFPDELDIRARKENGERIFHTFRLVLNGSNEGSNGAINCYFDRLDRQ